MAPFIVSGDGIVCHGKRPLRSGGMFVVSSGRWVYVECLVVGGAYLNVRVEAAHGLSLES